MPHEHSPRNFSSPRLLTHKQTLPREPQPTSHATRTFTKKLLFTSLAHAQTNIASRTSTNITCHTNIPHNTSLHLACSRTNKHCLANLNQHHMPHEHSPRNFSSPRLLTHKQTLPREPQPTSHATRTFTKKLLFTSLAHAQTNIASRTSTNITCHTNIPHNTSLHLACSRTNKHCLANLNQHHMPHEHSSEHFSSPRLLTHKQTLPREPQPTSHATRTFLITLLFTSLAHAQTNIASRTSTNITCHTNIPQNTSLHLACSRTNKHCLANLNQHHMPHECLLHVFPRRCAFIMRWDQVYERRVGDLCTRFLKVAVATRVFTVVGVRACS